MAADIKTPKRVDLPRSLGGLMTEQLLLMRRELAQEMMDNRHYDSLTEESRSSSSELLADPHLQMEVVMKILAKRGALTEQHLADYKASLPKTKRRVIFSPRQF